MATQLSEVLEFNPSSITLPNREVLRRLATSDSGFVFDPVNGESYTVNPSGLAVLNLLKDGRSFSEILEQLMHEFDVDTQKVERDVTDFIMQLRKHYG